jgi:hypothetical protein
MSGTPVLGEPGAKASHRKPRAHAWMARAYLAALCTSIALMAVQGIAGPSAPLVSFPAAPPWPPWFFHSGISPALSPLAPLLTVVLGGPGLVAGMVAVRRGWQPRPRYLIFGSVAAVLVLLLMPPVASGDPVFYAAYGRIAELGGNPYVARPIQLLAPWDSIRSVISHYSVDPPSRYGPLATLSEAAAAKLAGDSLARTIFWLKAWNAAAYLTLVLVLDRLVRSDGARRVRVHLLWSLNPLMLFFLMADGHNDAIAVALGALALLTFRKIDPRRACLASVLLICAIAVKVSYALYGLSLVWVMRHSLRSLAGLGFGMIVVLIPGYLLFGQGEITATTLGLVNGEQPNLLWRDAAALLGWQGDAALTNTAGLIGCALLAALLLWRIPSAAGDLVAVRIVLALTMALLIASSYQQGWYDAMIFPLLAVFPASRLDWIAVAHTAVLGVASVPFFYPRLNPPITATIERLGADSFDTLALCVIGLVLLWLCVTSNWAVTAGPGARPGLGKFMEATAGSVP